MTCPLCSSAAVEGRTLDNKDGRRFECETCGTFDVAGIVLASARAGTSTVLGQHAYLLSALARKANADSTTLFIDRAVCERVGSGKVREPTPTQQFGMLMRWFQKASERFGAVVPLDNDKHYPVAFCKDRSEWSALRDEAARKGFLRLAVNSAGFVLTLEGWEWSDGTSPSPPRDGLGLTIRAGDGGDALGAGSRGGDGGSISLRAGDGAPAVAPSTNAPNPALAETMGPPSGRASTVPAAQPRAAIEPIIAGAVVGESYRLVVERGRGAMGVVWEATHVRAGGRWAAKLLGADLATLPDALTRFEREAHILESIRHPHVVHLADFHRSSLGGRPCLIMEFVDGPTLDAYLKEKGGRLPTSEVVRIMSEAARGLAAAHAKGVVHRDLKPANIMLAKAAGYPNGFTKILDFGVAKLVEATRQLTSAGAIVGTPLYLSPEQSRGEPDIDGASDQFALASIAYELLTGRPPFGGDRPDVIIIKIAGPDPAPRMETGADAIDQVVMQALSKAKAQRFPDISAFADALEAAADLARPGSEPHARVSENVRGHFLPFEFDVAIEGEKFHVVVGESYRVRIFRERGPEGYGRWHGRLLADHIFDSSWPANATLYAAIDDAIVREMEKHRR